MQAKRFHIIYDLEYCNQKIVDRQALREFIETLAKMTKMNILEGPIVAEGKDENPGLSALAVIDYSHISIHTFTNFNEALIDVFSCREFDKQKTYEYCLEFFGTTPQNASIKEIWWG